MNILLSPHFSLQEFVYSNTAIKRDINNTPGIAIIRNLRRLALYLETARSAVRQQYGQDHVIVITSGYRSPELNRAVGGVPTSAHVRGLAADIHSPGIVPTDLSKFLADALADYDQIIDEGTWTHVGLSEGTPRMQKLLAHFDSTGKATYTEAA